MDIVAPVFVAHLKQAQELLVSAEKEFRTRARRRGPVDRPGCVVKSTEQRPQNTPANVPTHVGAKRALRARVVLGGRHWSDVISPQGEDRSLRKCQLGRS